MLRTITTPKVISKLKVKQAMRNPPGRLDDTIACELYNAQGQAMDASLG
jgi:hypothetical protein